MSGDVTGVSIERFETYYNTTSGLTLFTSQLHHMAIKIFLSAQLVQKYDYFLHLMPAYFALLKF